MRPSPLRAPTRGPCNDCPASVEALDRQTEAIREHAQAMHRVADALVAGGAHVEASVEKLEPVGQLAGAIIDWQAGVCTFLKKWGPRTLYFGPLLALLFGALQPNAARLLGTVIAYLMGAPAPR